MTNQLNDINPGFGPAVNHKDTGNGFGSRVFWTAAIPDSDVKVDLTAGTAELHVQNLFEYDYNSFNDSDQADWQYPQSAAHPQGFFDANVSFDVAWNGPVTQTDHVKDTANGFAGTFYQNDATVTWSASSTRPVGNSHFTFTSNPGNTSTTTNLFGPGVAFVQLATEQNGVFFPSGGALQPDPVDPTLTDLVVNGSSTGGIDIEVRSVHQSHDIRVQIHGAEQSYQQDFPAAAITRLIVNSGPGDNHIEVADDVRIPAVLMGSYGNDRIEGGGGPTIIVGGAGNMVGETGSDQLEGGRGASILIGGGTDFDRNEAALVAVLTEWSRSDESYFQKVANISNSTLDGVSPNGQGQNGGYFLNASTVHDDAAGNVLEGGPAMDWFFANLDGIGNNGVKDKIKGRQPGEIITHITL